MQTVRMVLNFEPDVAQLIDDNSTARTKAVFVSSCIRKAMRQERDEGGGALERLAQAVERAVKEMERAT